jgi:hypothetical protein
MKTHYLLALVPLFVSGCCDDRVDARAFVGHLTLSQCREYMNHPEAPTSISCPGDEITICWAAKGPDKVHVEVKDTNGTSQSFDDVTVGVMYLNPKEDTEVKITAGCASTTKKINVVNGNEAAEFDAHYDCQQIAYSVDPLFVSQSVMAIDATANWTPLVEVSYSDGSSSVVECTTPPFLSGWHPQELFGFAIDKPWITTPFSSPRHLVGDWQYVLKAQCPPTYGERVCNPYAQLPFAMTLMCKQ